MSQGLGLKSFAFLHTDVFGVAGHRCAGRLGTLVLRAALILFSENSAFDMSAACAKGKVNSVVESSQIRNAWR